MNNLHLFIGTPSYNGLVNVDYLMSFSNTINLLYQQNIPVTVEVRKSGTLLPAERNILFEKFYQSSASHMLCVDADTGWEANDVMKLLHKNKDIIAGAYISRHALDVYVFNADPSNDKLILEDGLIRLKHIGLGFMLVSRQAIIRMRNYFPQYKYTQQNIDLQIKTGYAFCDTEVRDGIHWGEDYTFCHRARQAGNEIWLDPNLRLNHNGKIGTFMDALKPCLQ